MDVDVPVITVDDRTKVAIITWPNMQPELDLWRTWFERVLEHPDFRPGFGIVSDRRALTMSPTAHFVRGFVQIVGRYVAARRFTGRWATVVAPTQMAVYGMGRMTEILSDSQVLAYRVFTDLDEAVAWASSPREPSAGRPPR